jgi:DNA-directed RNA polymerase subunit RPC12/RpoP
MKLLEIVEGDKIKCESCGWSWKISEGGDDLYICHKCGNDTNVDTMDESLKDLKFITSISDKHQKEIDYNRESGLFKDFDISKYKKIYPPKNHSKDTKEELKTLSSLPEQKDFVEKYDRIFKSFKEYAEQKDHKIPKSQIKEVIKSAAGIIYELKYHFNRPRPQQIAEQHDMEIGGMDLESAKSPSYPSGHSVQSKIVGEMLVEVTKDLEYRKIAEKISISRNVGRVHFPSDSKLGEKLGEDLFEFLKNKR